MSVSPKTCVPSLPSSAGHASISEPKPDTHQISVNSAPTIEPPDRERQATPGTKRKLDDRGLHSDELDRQRPRPPPFEDVNETQTAAHAPPSVDQTAAKTGRRRVIYREVPIFARELLRNQKPNHLNFIMRKGHERVATLEVNGKPDGIKQEGAIKQDGPIKQEPGAEMSRTRAASGPPQPAQEPPPRPQTSLLGDWEPSILGKRPYEEVSKMVADELFMLVVNNPEMGEIQSRGVQFEIEAKLGLLISKDTLSRVGLPATTECLLADNGRVQFTSSMTEVSR